jgi:hypothetical protein
MNGSNDEEQTMGSTTTGTGAAGADEVGQRAREGVAHLQAAARELIAAARAALDVAEDLVGDPDSAAALVGVLAGLGDLARRAAPARSPHGGDAGTGDDAADAAGPVPAEGRVERIRVM